MSHFPSLVKSACRSRLEFGKSALVGGSGASEQLRIGQVDKCAIKVKDQV